MARPVVLRSRNTHPGTEMHEMHNGAGPGTPPPPACRWRAGDRSAYADSGRAHTDSGRARTASRTFGRKIDASGAGSPRGEAAYPATGACRGARTASSSAAAPGAEAGSAAQAEMPARSTLLIDDCRSLALRGEGFNRN